MQYPLLVTLTCLNTKIGIKQLLSNKNIKPTGNILFAMFVSNS